jgi:hypothetical protein
MAIQTDAPKAIWLVRHSSAALAALSSRSWRRAQLTFLPKALLLLMVTHLEGAISLQRPLNVCAVTRRRFPVGASPTRQPLQPEATGAVMEVTKWLKPSV